MGKLAAKNRNGDESWRAGAREARHWLPPGEDGRLECTLSPRHCKLREGQIGYCGVRRNIGGVLHTDNYGRAVAAAEEVIETEAIYHYRPGARILSLGNIGCMMSCKFCQNWTTSQVRHLDERVVQTFTPEQIVDLAEERGIGVISWTYNDPVVWHEFVVDTSALARQRGIRTLYKSALYIEPAPLGELIEVIDIFSVSLKSLDPEFYRKITHAHLEPVLDGIRQIHETDRHLEISQLLISGLNDRVEDVRQTVDWHLENLSPDVPLHFVAFHPAYQYLDAPRTPRETLLAARDTARDLGVSHVYLGNLYEEGVADTCCHACGATLVCRFGLTVDAGGISPEGRCTNCGTPAAIAEPHGARIAPLPPVPNDFDRACTIDWSEELQSAHLELPNPNAPRAQVLVERDWGDRHLYELGGGMGRVIVSRARADERTVTVRYRQAADLRVLPVKDRAHLFTEGN